MKKALGFKKTLKALRGGLAKEELQAQSTAFADGTPPPHRVNRANRGEDIFREKRNCLFFMERYAKYIEPIAYNYAYCLLRNHFHFLVRTRMLQEQEAYQKTLKVSEIRVVQPSRQFSKLFNSYAKAFNKTYDRTGSLFEHPFHRIEVDASK